ncbi:MAG TPA: hypothetical protein VD969_29125 [Symbiobacteriaceae bacterium]|nr:hypothetical protein [Symbiobacteriaceae bacterium]
MTGSSGKRPVSIVYAGGDDLFVVGAWDQTLELAFDLHSAFDRFTGGRLTISAGLVADDYHVPIHRLAEAAGEAEEAAKEHKRPDEEKDRNSIAPLFPGKPVPHHPSGRVRAVAFKWDDARAMLTNFLEPALGPLGRGNRPGTRVPRGLIYGLLGLTELWEEQGMLYLPRLAYMLARVDKRVRELPSWKPWRDYLMKHPQQMAGFAPFVQWMDLIGRGGNGDE